MKKFWPVLFCLTILLCLGHLASGGGWVSVGSPPAPPIPPGYDYKYTCFVEVSDEKRLPENDSYYYLVATTHIDFEKTGEQAKTFFKGSELQWKLQKFSFAIKGYTDEVVPGDIPFSYLEHTIRLIVDARSSSQGESADQDTVLLSTVLAQDIAPDKTIHYRSSSTGVRASSYIHDEVRSSVTDKKTLDDESLMIRVSCDKKL